MKRLLVLAALLSASSSVACGPDYDHLEITTQPSKLGGKLDVRRLEVPVGGIVKAHLAPIDDDRKLMAASVRSLDPSVLEATRVVSESDFAFLGLREGRTQVEIRADGDLVLVVDAVVVPQARIP